MAYCSQSDLENAIEENILIELSDDDKDGVIDSGIVERAIADADAIVNSYLRKVFSVPLDPPIPDIVRKLSVDLSIYNLFARRAAHFDTPEWLIKKHDDSFSMLRAINRGEIDLDVEPPPANSAAQVASVNYPTRLFTDSTLEDF